MYEGAIQDLIDELGRLPGVGPKSAQRIAFHLLAAEPADVERLASTLIRVKIRADSFDPSDTEDLEDLIVAAYRDAKARSDAMAAEAFQPLAGGLGALGGPAAGEDDAHGGPAALGF
ncbi:MAG: recombination protein RecR [Nocardioidaceae bacterium]|nr:recombination protein RecR [Nocardioidaceae bacterium]